MSSLRQLWIHSVMAGLGVLAVCAGIVVGAPGCMDCDCTDPPWLEPGAYEIIDSPVRPELVGGMLEFSTERVEISYTDAEGQSWVVDYVVER